ncbi:MAG: RnfABCDGE type electron transport complex subunit B [Oscillospiraceae bacterium]|nr:RnfABCDGE type electron transport complex subunit B [Oscillospiraceae bacterium]
MEYLIPILFFATISGVAGAVLAIAGKIFHIESDEKVETLVEILPGINCGACGFASCEQYAVAIKNGEAEANKCKPGGVEAVEKISAVLGTVVDTVEQEVAFVRCAGVCGTKYEYVGTQSCRASGLYYNGNETCRYSCAGLGDCMRACPQNAIAIGENNRAIVAYYKCNACGLCAKACPKGIIGIQAISRTVHVACSSEDKGKLTRQVCSKGCIGCKICEKKCPKQAISVTNNLAVVNYDLCDSCAECVSACPAKCIIIRKECDVLIGN